MALAALYLLVKGIDNDIQFAENRIDSRKTTRARGLAFMLLTLVVSFEIVSLVIRRMNNRLARIISTLRQGSESVSVGADQMAATSSELAAATEQVAGGLRTTGRDAKRFLPSSQKCFPLCPEPKRSARSRVQLTPIQSRTSK